MFFSFLSVGLQLSDQKELIAILFNAVGGCLMVIWFMIALSQIKLRRELEAEGELRVKMWGFPVLSWVTVAMLIALLILMLSDPGARMQIIAVSVLAVVLIAASFLAPGSRNKQAADVVT